MSRKPYPSDLTDAQWAELALLLPPDATRGHPRTTNLRVVVNGPPEADTCCVAAYPGPPQADWLRWPTGVVGLGHRGMVAHHGEAQTGQPPLRSAAPTVGVECTLAWMARCRRLSQDYEERTENSETWVHVAMVNLMLKRLQAT